MPHEGSRTLVIPVCVYFIYLVKYVFIYVDTNGKQVTT